MEGDVWFLATFSNISTEEFLFELKRILILFRIQSRKNNTNQIKLNYEITK